jgi:hypothetical protein
MEKKILPPLTDSFNPFDFINLYHFVFFFHISINKDRFVL